MTTMKKWNSVSEEWEYLGIGNNEIVDHLSDTDNPHEVTAVQAGAQPVDPTLTALAGVTVTADKLIYGTGSDTLSTTNFTAAARSLLDDTTVSAMRTTLAAASSTTAAQTIWVDSAATGAADGTSKTDAFTTFQDAWDSLPSIINHTIEIVAVARSTPYSAGINVGSRVVSAGSIVIKGEYYFYGVNTSSKTGKIDVGSSDYGYGDRAQIASGDKISLLKWVGTVGSSTPSESFEDTVASISDTEITLTTNTGKVLDTSWSYFITKTNVIVNATTGFSFNSAGTSLSIVGLYIASNSYPIYNLNLCNITVSACILEVNTASGNCIRSQSTGFHSLSRVVLKSNYASVKGIYVFTSSVGASLLSGSYVVIALSNTDTTGVLIDTSSSYFFRYAHIRQAAVGISVQRNSLLRKLNVQNDAGTPEDPITSSDASAILT